MKLDSIKALTDLVLRHRDEREWGQFHNPKELAISLSVEAAELLALMQWKNGEQLADALRRAHRSSVMSWRMFCTQRFCWPRIWKSTSAPRLPKSSQKTPPSIRSKSAREKPQV